MDSSTPTSDRDSNSPYEIVRYEERHRDEVLRLRTEFWAIDATWNAAHFEWQHEKNPCFESDMIRLALFEGRIVGMRILQAAEWQSGVPPRRFRAPTFVGTYIEPAHRLRGLFAELTRSVEEDLIATGIGWALNTSPAPATLVASLAEGWRSIGALGTYVREPSVRGARFDQRVRRNLARLVGWLRPPLAGVQISDEVRATEMADLVSRQSMNDGRIRRVRDEAFFRWRFRDPSSRYRFVYFDRDGQLQGFAVLHRRAAPSQDRTLHLVDWGIDAGMTWENLLDIVTDYADRIQQSLITWEGTHPVDARERLVDFGFSSRKEPGPLARSRPTILVRKIGLDPESEDWTVGSQTIDDAGCWDLRMTDSDMF